VLHDVSFKIDSGECVGIIGRNGCGKSTLLKILAGIIVPDSGTVDVSGPVSPFLELGVGFNAELSVRDNIELYGSVLGLTESEIINKYDDIISFAALEGFQQAKLKTLSSGMQVRAAFSVASKVESDIYLADEVLAVGDARFQEKCLHSFQELRERGKTIAYVSHDMSSIDRFCDRAIWLDNGVVAAIGESRHVINAYLDSLKLEDRITSNVSKSLEKGDVRIEQVVALTPRREESKQIVRVHFSFECETGRTLVFKDCEVDDS